MITVKRYGPYSGEYGHLFYIDVYEDGTRKSIWAHREIMEAHAGRTLTKNEVVHHKNEITNDNRIENLEIKTWRTHAQHHAKLPEMIECICPQCEVKFFTFASFVRHKQGKYGCAGPFCSKSCSGKWSRQLQIDNGINLNTSRAGYRGAYVETRRGKPYYTARMRVEGKLKYMGSFPSLLEAAKAHDKFAFELFGSKAYLNFPEDYAIKEEPEPNA